MTAPHRLGSTYRLQLNGLGPAGRAFDRAAEVVPFLSDLGVQTCYLSPIAAAMPGSTHGYDVIDPTEVDPVLGGRAGLDRLLGVLETHGMSALIDIVPNHVAASPTNPYFHDLLLHGRRSAYAPWFDVAWERADGRIVLPVLDGSISEVIGRGDLRVDRDPATGDFGFRLGATRYPADPGPEPDDLVLLAELAGSDPSTDQAVARQVELLVSHQHYRLVDWRLANRAINYRRFFAINELIGIRQEDPEVFSATHALVASLAADERIAGFRVDHVDGMRDPADYLSKLRELVDAGGRRHVIEVEKILARDEVLPDWPVDGTTGYDVAAAITGVLLCPTGVQSIAAEQLAATGDDRPFDIRAVEAKYGAARTMFTGQVEVVGHQLAALGIAADFDLITDVVEALTANIGVYRTYRREGEQMQPADTARLRAAAAGARAQLTPAAGDALEKVVAVLCGPLGADGPGMRAVAGWQQLTSAVVAKGVEDTATFNAGQLLAGCDVGAEPGEQTWSVDDWHRFMAVRQRDRPHAMSAGSTHDSKRSLDVRCRLAVLSELGTTWRDVVVELDAIETGSQIGPAARRYLYQTLLGSWPVDGTSPDFVQRVQDHVVKAAREAAIETTWNDPNEKYESAYQGLVSTMVDGAGRELLASVAAQIAPAGATNSLASVVLGATAPGVPDVYQGDDLWLFALTDPDNRRPVDWARHQQAWSTDASALMADWRSGAVKQHVLRQCLRLRGRLGEWWDRADYAPVEVRGAAADHVLAFARTVDDQAVVTVVPRLPLTLAGPGAFPIDDIWEDVELVLPAGDAPWRDVLTDRDVELTSNNLRLWRVLDQLPVAVLRAG
jgi:(1->4)-alpha-D-glucan 1-alpha-D-glucosylmutase